MTRFITDLFLSSFLLLPFELRSSYHRTVVRSSGKNHVQQFKVHILQQICTQYDSGGLSQPAVCYGVPHSAPLGLNYYCERRRRGSEARISMVMMVMVMVMVGI